MIAHGEYRLVPTADRLRFTVAVVRPGVERATHTKDLAALEDPDAPPGRMVRFVLADEGNNVDPLTGDVKPSFRLSFRRWSRAPVVPLIIESDGAPLRVGGVVQLKLHPSGCIPGAVGQCLVGTATLNTSILASVFWQAIRGGLINGVCAVVAAPAWLARIRRARIEAVRLGTLAGGSCPRARIMESWIANGP